jgi:hypothetical protein
MTKDFLFTVLNALNSLCRENVAMIDVSDKAWIECSLGGGVTMRIHDPLRLTFLSNGTFEIENGSKESHIFPAKPIRWRNRDSGQILGFGEMGMG